MAGATSPDGTAPMRLLIAMMSHETNTFSPVPTPLARFCHGRAAGRRGAIDRFRGTGPGLGGYLDIAARERAEVELPIAASASPSRPGGQRRVCEHSPVRSATR